MAVGTVAVVGVGRMRMMVMMGVVGKWGNHENSLRYIELRYILNFFLASASFILRPALQ
jgi:hypothetical protein